MDNYCFEKDGNLADVGNKKKIMCIRTGALAAIGGILKLRQLELKSTKPPPYLDSTLLAAAQAGVYLHCLFGAVGGVLTIGPNWGLSLGADFIALVQSTSQTLLVQVYESKKYMSLVRVRNE